METKQKLNIYFDGACPLCSREINHYRKKDSENKLNFIDISSSSFDAKAEGLDEKEANKYFHVKTPEGELLTGVPAFAAIWDTLGMWSVLSRFSKSFIGSNLMGLGYSVFAELRPYLPKSESCEVCQR